MPTGRFDNLAVLAAVVLGALLIPRSPAAGQGGHGVRLRQPSEPGANMSLRLRQYSFGLGGLESITPSPDSGVLRSSISYTASFSIPRSHTATPPIPFDMAPPVTDFSGERVYDPLPPAIVPRRPAKAGAGLAQAPGAMTVAREYIEAIGVVSAGVLADRAQAIASLVPREPGLYRDHMAKAEEAFRRGDFNAAFDEFRLANLIRGRSPESLLGMAHSRFATARHSYSAASFYLQEAIKYLPELPLVPLEVKSLYGDPRAYARCLDYLDEHLKKSDTDADGYLLLAYFRWFDQDAAGAEEALSRARSACKAAGSRQAKSDPLVEAITAFHDGMVASGRIGGALPPSTRPANN